jgi:hypothetical protein
MMLSRIPSVKDTYFHQKVLTRIHGKPIYKSLQTLTTELKANAGSVPCTMVSPVNPGPFVPPAGGTGPQIEAAKDVWRKLQQTVKLCQATGKALVAQIVASIDPIYIRALLLNRATGQYSSSICTVILRLFTVYGKITPKQVKGKEMELYNMHYDISQPVDTVFNAIDLLSLLNMPIPLCLHNK